MLFIGLDMSLTCTGVVVLDEQFTCLKAEPWSPPASVSAEENSINGKFARVLWFLESIESLIDWARSRDADIRFITEGYAYSSGDPHLGEVGGVIKLTFFQKTGRYPLIITPTSTKLFATKKGNSPKSVMITHVLKRWGMDFSEMGKKGEDVADAYAICRTGASKILMDLGRWAPSADYEVRAMDGINKPRVRTTHRKRDNELIPVP